MRRRWPWLVLAVLAALLALVAWFPAAWAWRMAQDRLPQLRIRAVHGSVWNGRAEQVEYAGMPLGQVDWSLSRAALFGAVALELHMDGPLLRGSGRFRRTGADRVVGTAIDVDVHVDRIPASVGSPGLEPGGELAVRIPRVVLDGHWPRQLTGHADWRDATLADRAGPVVLGTLHADVRERAGTELEASFSDAGGPLAVSGTAEVTTLGWRLDARLAPRTGSPRLRGILAHLGTPDAQGAVRLQRHGGMVMGETP